jgi:ornithine cyclodeaminase
MRFLSANDVRQAVSVADAVDAVANAFAQLSTGHADVPLRLGIGQAQHDSHTFFMPALVEGSSVAPAALGLKVVSVFPHNAARHNLPTIHALVALFEPTTGQPLAVMDGRVLTALRTGAVSGVATRVLARTDSQTLAIFGAGGQAPFQVLAVCAVRSIGRVLVVNRTRARAEQLITTLTAAGVQAEFAIVTASAALAEADVVCCATSATTPIFEDRDVRPGTHINGVGSFTPAMVEVPTATLARARVVVDQRSAAWSEAGDLLAAKAAGVLDESRTDELGEVVAGVAPGRHDPNQITFFKSVGNAVQDLAVAQLAVAAAIRLGLGVELTM